MPQLEHNNRHQWDRQQEILALHYWRFLTAMVLSTVLTSQVVNLELHSHILTYIDYFGAAIGLVGVCASEDGERNLKQD